MSARVSAWGGFVPVLSGGVLTAPQLRPSQVNSTEPYLRRQWYRSLRSVVRVRFLSDCSRIRFRDALGFQGYHSFMTVLAGVYVYSHLANLPPTSMTSLDFAFIQPLHSLSFSVVKVVPLAPFSSSRAIPVEKRSVMYLQPLPLI